MGNPLYSLLVALLIYPAIVMGINRVALLQVGAVHKQYRQLSFYTQGPASYIVVKLVPSLNSVPNNCTINSLDRYKATVADLLRPLADNIASLNNALVPQHRRRRFAGVAIGLAALGVAAAAQTTAAIALVETRANSQKLQAMSESIQNTNQAVQEIKGAISASAVAIQAIQTQINEVINPSLTKLSCEIIDNQLASILNLYLIQLTTVFQNQLTNPALSPLSVQALSSIMQSTAVALNNLTSNNSNINADLLTAGLITGQVVGVNLTSLQIIIAAFTPSIADLPGAIVHDFIIITTAVNKTEVQVQIPQRIMEQNGVIYNFPGSECKAGLHRIYCPYSDASTLSRPVQSCLNGNLHDCIFANVIGSFPTRFATVNGVIFANCQFMSCSCLNPQKIIYPMDGEMISQIDVTKCMRLNLNLLDFIITTQSNITFQSQFSANLDQIIKTNPIDLSAELKQINTSLDNAQGFLDKSTAWLKMSGWIDNSGTVFIILIIAVVVIIAYMVFISYAFFQTVKEIRIIKKSLYMRSKYHNSSVSSIDELI